MTDRSSCLLQKLSQEEGPTLEFKREWYRLEAEIYAKYPPKANRIVARRATRGKQQEGVCASSKRMGFSNARHTQRTG